MSAKPKILFLHIIKCGGTSLRHMLLDEYGAERIAPVPVGLQNPRVRYPTLAGVDPLRYQATVPAAALAKYDVIMSHYDWRITRRFPERQIITLLRHPVAQLFSLYRFKRKNREIPQQDFRAWLLSEDVTPNLNVQTRFLSGHGVENLDEALANLDDARLHIGLLDFFPETVKRWNRYFGWSLRIQHKNKSGRHRPLDAETRAIAQALQHDDMILWADATARFGGAVA